MSEVIYVCQYCENSWPSTDKWYCQFCGTPYRVTKTIENKDNMNKELNGTWKQFKSSINDEQTIALLKKIDEKATENLNNASRNSTVKIMKKNKLIP
jgi:hypothetical protein